MEDGNSFGKLGREDDADADGEENEEDAGADGEENEDDAGAGGEENEEDAGADGEENEDGAEDTNTAAPSTRCTLGATSGSPFSRFTGIPKSWASTSGLRSGVAEKLIRLTVPCTSNHFWRTARVIAGTTSSAQRGPSLSGLYTLIESKAWRVKLSPMASR